MFSRGVQINFPLGLGRSKLFPTLVAISQEWPETSCVEQFFARSARLDISVNMGFSVFAKILCASKFYA